MEIFNHLLARYLGKFLNSKEWRQVELAPGSPFLGIPGGGGVKAVYQRAWWPTLVRLLGSGLSGLWLFLIVYLLLAAVYFMDGYLARAVNFTTLRLIQLSVLAVVFIFVYYWIKSMAPLWTARTPRSVAVLGCGLAWLEADTLRYWTWDQLKDARTAGYFLVIENKSGQAARFYNSLANTEFGRQARLACGIIAR